MFSILLGMYIAAPGRGSLEALVGAASLAGIYSLSFLELWALADGGYSLRILEHVDSQDERREDFSRMHTLGEVKKNERIQSLVKLRLIHERNGMFNLTRWGQVVGIVLRVIAWPSKSGKF